MPRRRAPPAAPAFRPSALTIREHILDRTIYLMGKMGTTEVSVRAIAKEAGVNVAAVNYYFSSKDQMLAQMGERFLHGYGEVMKLLDSPGLPPEERLRRWAGEVMHFLAEYPGVISLMERQMEALRRGAALGGHPRGPPAARDAQGDRRQRRRGAARLQAHPAHLVPGRPLPAAHRPRAGLGPARPRPPAALPRPAHRAPEAVAPPPSNARPRRRRRAPGAPRFKRLDLNRSFTTTCLRRRSGAAPRGRSARIATRGGSP